MSFVNPQFFWILIVPLILFTFLITINKERLSRIFDEKVLKRLSATNESMPMVVRNILMLIAISLMIVAFARPVMEKGDKKVNIGNLTYMKKLNVEVSPYKEQLEKLQKEKR